MITNLHHLLFLPCTVPSLFQVSRQSYWPSRTIYTANNNNFRWGTFSVTYIPSRCWLFQFNLYRKFVQCHISITIFSISKFSIFFPLGPMGREQYSHSRNYRANDQTIEEVSKGTAAFHVLWHLWNIAFATAKHVARCFLILTPRSFFSFFEYIYIHRRLLEFTGRVTNRKITL